MHLTILCFCYVTIICIVHYYDCTIIVSVIHTVLPTRPSLHTHTHTPPPIPRTYLVGHDGHYIYTDDLLLLHTKSGESVRADSRLSSVHTPLSIAAWQACLSNHLDADFVWCILNGLQQGFRIGADSTVHLCSVCTVSFS